MELLSIICTMASTAWANWQNFFSNLREKALLIIGVLFAAFRWLFDPNPVWGYIWIMFILSFATKMLELWYSEEKGRFCKETFESRFSSAEGAAKAGFKVAIFTITMIFLSLGKKTNHTLFGWVEPGVLTLLFTNEGLNNYKHLSAFPATRSLVQNLVDVFKLRAKKVIDLKDDDDDLPLP